MKPKLREILKETNEKLKSRYQKDSEGRAVIRMTVKNDDDFLSVFSENETPVISPDVAAFIESSTVSIPPHEELTLSIHSHCIDDGEKELYKAAIKEYYTQQYIAAKEELRRNRLITLALTLAGILVLSFEILFDLTIGNAVWTEVIDIAAWVLLWEAVDISVFGSHSLRIKQRRCLAYLSMKIEYIDTLPPKGEQTP